MTCRDLPRRAAKSQPNPGRLHGQSERDTHNPPEVHRPTGAEPLELCSAFPAKPFPALLRGPATLPASADPFLSPDSMATLALQRSNQTLTRSLWEVKDGGVGAQATRALPASSPHNSVPTLAFQLLPVATLPAPPSPTAGGRDQGGPKNGEQLRWGWGPWEGTCPVHRAVVTPL